MIGLAFQTAGMVGQMLSSAMPDKKDEKVTITYNPDSFKDLGLSKYMYAGLNEDKTIQETLKPSAVKQGLAVGGSTLSLAGGLVNQYAGQDKDEE